MNEFVKDAVFQVENFVCEGSRHNHDLIVGLLAEIERLTAEIETLREEVQIWKDRFVAERHDHEATMKAWDEERSGL